MGRLRSVALFDYALVVPLDRLVALEVADVVPTSGHFHAVKDGMGAHPRHKRPRCIGPASVGDGVLDLPGVFLFVEIEGRRAPVGLRLLWLFLQREENIPLPDFGTAVLSQALYVLSQ